MKRFSKIILATVCVLYGSLAWGDVLPQYMSELEKPLFPEGDMLNVEFLKEDEVHKVNKSTKYVLRDTENTVVACIEIRSIFYFYCKIVILSIFASFIRESVFRT